MPRKLAGRQALAFQTAERLRVLGTGCSSERQAAGPAPSFLTAHLLPVGATPNMAVASRGGQHPFLKRRPPCAHGACPWWGPRSWQAPSTALQAATGDRCLFAELISGPSALPFQGRVCLGLCQNAGPSNTENRPVSLAHRA